MSEKLTPTHDTPIENHEAENFELSAEDNEELNSAEGTFQLPETILSEEELTASDSDSFDKLDAVMDAHYAKRQAEAPRHEIPQELTEDELNAPNILEENNPNRTTKTYEIGGTKTLQNYAHVAGEVATKNLVAFEQPETSSKAATEQEEKAA